MNPTCSSTMCVFSPLHTFKPVIYQPYFKCLKVHMICMIKADLFSQKWTQHHMDWNRLSTMDPIFGIYFRCILNRLCLFLNLRNFSQHGRDLLANVHYAPYCSELMIFYWSVFLLLCTHQVMSYYVLIASRSDARHFYVLSWLCIWMFVHSVYIVYMLLLVGD